MKAYLILLSFVFYLGIAFTKENPTAADSEGKQIENSPSEPMGVKSAPNSSLKENGISLEVLGRAAFYSLNYDRRISEIFGAGFGLSYVKLNDAPGAFLMPIYINIYPIPAMRRLFITAGATLAPLEKTEKILAVPGIGYEYKNDDGLLLRGSLYQLYSSKSSIPIWFGLSIGQSF